MKFSILKTLALILFSMTLQADEIPKDNALFNIKTFCRSSISEAKSKLPVDFKYVQVEKRDSKHYGHEETWIVNDKTQLQSIGLDMIQIEIHQNQVQMLWLINNAFEKSKKSTRLKNLARVGLSESELIDLKTEKRVNTSNGFIIRILGDQYDYYECFEYHAGH